MDGKKQWWWILPLFILYLPKLLWIKVFPPKASTIAEDIKKKQSKALYERMREVNRK